MWLHRKKNLLRESAFPFSFDRSLRSSTCKTRAESEGKRIGALFTFHSRCQLVTWSTDLLDRLKIIHAKDQKQETKVLLAN